MSLAAVSANAAANDDANDDPNGNAKESAKGDTAPAPPRTAYRADIDGLRAVAVIAVIVYHAGLAVGAPWLPGGFVGVDVFFVISGFLITRLILADLERGRFSLVDFWDRRIRRIVPALLAMLAVTSVAAGVILIPSELADYGASLTASVAFVANMYFRSKVGYFEGRAEDQPLLHTWSLAIEEQFYILWPISLFLVARYGARYGVESQRSMPAIKAWMAVSWVASFGLGEAFIDSRPEAVFYYLPTRAWELVTGAMVAAGMVARPTPVVAAAMSAGGLMLIGFAAMTFDTASIQFPGASALVPCLGAVGVIVGGMRSTVVSRALGSALPVFVGRMSYSAYLWHWPVLVLARLYLLRPLSTLEVAIAIATTLVLALISVRFIEDPMRRLAPGRIGPVPLSVPLAAAFSLAVAGVGATLTMTEGRAYAAAPGFVALQRDLLSGARQFGHCFQRPKTLRVDGFDGCIEKLEGASGSGTVWLWGDSHARAMFPAVVAAANQTFSSLNYRFVSSCSPLMGVDFVSRNNPDGSLQACKRYVDATIAEIVADRRATHVVLAGRWTVFAEDNAVNPANQVYLTAAGDGSLVREHSRLELRKALSRAVARIEASGKKVLVVTSVPEYGHDAARCFVRARWLGRDPSACAEDTGRVRRRIERTTGILEQVARDMPRLGMVRPADILCGSGACVPWDEKGLLYYDTNHLSSRGALKLVDAFTRELR